MPLFNTAPISDATAQRFTKIRTFEVTDLKVREDTTDGRTISGLVVPYEIPTLVNDGDGKGNYVEVMRSGVFAKSIQEAGGRILLNELHNERSQPLAMASAFREAPNGLYGDFPLLNTSAGNDALELVRQDIYVGFSVGFAPLRNTKRSDGSVERTEAKLLHVALVPKPAYSEAKVLALREENTTQGPSIADLRAELEELKRFKIA